MTNYERIKNMSVEEMSKYLAMHIDHYRAPHEVKEIYQSNIDNNAVRGVTWIKAFEKWLNENFNADNLQSGGKR